MKNHVTRVSSIRTMGMMDKKGNKAMISQNLKQQNRADHYMILSIDGGGIRGLIPATVLIHLEKLIQKKHHDKGKIGDYFDCSFTYNCTYTLGLRQRDGPRFG